MKKTILNRTNVLRREEVVKNKRSTNKSKDKDGLRERRYSAQQGKHTGTAEQGRPQDVGRNTLAH